MANVKPMDRAEVGELEPFMNMAEAAMGFLPNSIMTMSHIRQLVPIFSLFVATVRGADAKALMNAIGPQMPDQEGAELNIGPDLIQLIAYATSISSGCSYCQAHTSHGAHQTGIEEEKLQDLLRYEESELFSRSEKAAIAIAFAAGRVPNETSKNHFDDLREHFEERQIVQIVAVISLFGFLNRWNDTMATQLESEPTEFAESVLSDGGWALGKHKG